MRIKIIVSVVLMLCVITQSVSAKSTDNRFIGCVDGKPFYANDIHEMETHFGAGFWHAYKNDKGTKFIDTKIDFNNVNIVDYLQRLVELEKLRIEYAKDDPSLLTAEEKKEKQIIDTPATSASEVATKNPKTTGESNKQICSTSVNLVRERQLKERQKYWKIELKDVNIVRIHYSNKLKEMPKMAIRMVDTAPQRHYKTIAKINNVEYKQFTDHLPDNTPIVAYTNSPYPELF